MTKPDFSPLFDAMQRTREERATADLLWRRHKREGCGPDCTPERCVVYESPAQVREEPCPMRQHLSHPNPHHIWVPTGPWGRTCYFCGAREEPPCECSTHIIHGEPHRCEKCWEPPSADSEPKL